jgi:hypothetical protein
MRARRGRLAGAALALALAAAGGAARAEDATPLLGPAAASGPTTALESYLVQPGRLLVERTYGLAPIALEGGARLSLEAVVAYEPAREHERVLGVRARLAGGAGERVAHLDLHEVEDLARSLAALPAVAELERGQQAAVEIRYTTRDGFGVAVATGAAAPRRVLRFAGTPPVAIPLSEAALGELRIQLDGCRRYLFEE